MSGDYHTRRTEPEQPLVPATPFSLVSTQSYVEKVHLAPHGQKRKRFEAVASHLNSQDAFIRVGGVSQSKMEDVYKRVMGAHRDKVTSGDFSSGEREGTPSAIAIQYVCSKLMQEEDEFRRKTGKMDQVRKVFTQKAGKEVRLLDHSLFTSKIVCFSGTHFYAYTLNVCLSWRDSPSVFLATACHPQQTYVVSSLDPKIGIDLPV